MKRILLTALASLATASLTFVLPAHATSRMDQAFVVLSKTAAGPAAEALQAARAMIQLQDRTVKRLPQVRATGLVAVVTYLHERELAMAVEESLTSGVTADDGLFPALRAASLRWVDRAEGAGKATLRKVKGADFHGFFAELRATVAAGWDYVLRLQKSTETFRAAALEATVAKPGAHLRKAFLAFQKWAQKSGLEAVREAFDETMMMIQEGIIPGAPQTPATPPPAAVQPVG